jgi:hypothetical protein
MFLLWVEKAQRKGSPSPHSAVLCMGAKNEGRLTVTSGVARADQIQAHVQAIQLNPPMPTKLPRYL